MGIKLIVIDLDGTLLRSDLSVGERTLSAIRRAMEMGVKVTFATGRMVSASRRYAQLVGINAPMIALNGAIVKDCLNADVLYHRRIDDGSFRRILPVLAESRAASTVVCEDRAFGWNIDEDMRRKLSSWIVNIEEVSFDGVPQSPTIALIAGDENAVRRTADRIRGMKLKGVQVFLFPSIRYYPMWYFELRAFGVDKGTGLRALVDSLGLRRENVLVIGDYVNDLPMFQEAGVRAAVANSHEDVIKNADYVSPLSNDLDGVGEIIEEIVLR